MVVIQNECAGVIDSDSDEDGLMFDTDPPLSLEEYTQIYPRLLNVN